MTENLLIIGARDSDIAAIEVLCRMHWKNLHCISQKPGLFSRAFSANPTETSARYVIVDLMGLGMPSHSSANAERLFKLLGGRPAVVLTPGNGGRWEADTSADLSSQKIVWLKKPYKSMALREAIQQIMQPGRESRTNDTRVALGTANHLSTASHTWQQPADSEVAGIERLMDAIPALRALKPVALIRNLATSTGPQHLTIGSATVIVDYPAGWLATSLMQPSILLHVLRQPGQSDRLEPGTWSAQEIEAFMSQLGSRAGNVRKPLDTFLWDFLAIVTRQVTLESRANLFFKLKYLPNFAQIDQVEPFDLRLATICAKSPQSIRNLRAAIPGHDTEILRFVALCTLAGLGVITDEPVALGTTKGQPPATAANKEHRSFLRKFLDKLS